MTFELMILIDKTEDLIKQATTEKSHYYTARILKELLFAIACLDKELVRLKKFEGLEDVIATWYAKNGATGRVEQLANKIRTHYTKGE